MEDRREQAAGGPRCQGLQDTHQVPRAEACQGGYQGPRQFIKGCGRGPLFDGLLHVVVRRRGPRDQRFRWPGQCCAHARDEVTVVCGIARMQGGLEAREVQGEARIAAVQLLRLAEKLLLEGLRRAREADAVRAHLGEEAELGRPEVRHSPCLGRQGHPLQLGLLHTQEGSVRCVLALLPLGLDRVRCR